MNKVNFILRADSQIGSGHLMRCLKLANTLKGLKISFVTPHLSEDIQNLILQQGYENCCVENFDEVPKVLSQNPCDLLIVDCYELDARFEQKCRPWCKILAVIDDLYNRPHCCDYLIDGNIGNEAQNYTGLVQPDCTLLIGSEYTMTDHSFYQMRKKSVAKQFRRGFICFGGADPIHATLKCVQSITQSAFLQQFEYTVIAGALNHDYDTIAKYLQPLKERCVLLRHSSNIPQLMHDHDFAIGACGGMSYERLCVGIPSIHVQIADNQVNFGKLMQLYNVGKMLTVKELENPHLVEEAIIYLQEHGDEIRIKSQTIINGKGLFNIAQKLTEALNDQSI